MSFDIPNLYIGGAPFYWAYEQTGRLRIAVHNYLNDCMTLDDRLVIKKYLIHWINCPNWLADDLTKLETLREEAPNLLSEKQIYAFVDKMLDLGIDPF